MPPHQPDYSTRHRLQIFVMGACAATADAQALAAIVSGWNIRDLDVHIVDLSVPGSIRPDSVFAVPTYVLDGVIIHLGNPAEDEIRGHLECLRRTGRCP